MSVTHHNTNRLTVRLNLARHTRKPACHACFINSFSQTVNLSGVLEPSGRHKKMAALLKRHSVAIRS